jgi:hypothetical protein
MIGAAALVWPLVFFGFGAEFFGTLMIVNPMLILHANARRTMAHTPVSKSSGTDQPMGIPDQSDEQSIADCPSVTP